MSRVPNPSRALRSINLNADYASPEQLRGMIVDADKTPPVTPDVIAKIDAESNEAFAQNLAAELKRRAEWAVKAVQTAEAWQANPNVHPLTCGVNSDHRPLVPELRDGAAVLFCPDCSYGEPVPWHIVKD
jgi:hypothetical protein